jgi:aconitase A
MINPGSEQIRYTIERDGFLDVFAEVGATVFTNACGPCIGMWDRVGAEKKEKNTIIHSFNRNFAKRADGNPNTYAFVASPELVAAMAISGDLTFNPLTDTLTNEKGEQVKLDKKNILIGKNTHFKIISKRINLNTINKFYIKNSESEVKNLIRYNIENYKDDIINGYFPIEYLDYNYLSKKKDTSTNYYKKAGPFNYN